MTKGCPWLPAWFGFTPPPLIQVTLILLRRYRSIRKTTRQSLLLHLSSRSFSANFLQFQVSIMFYIYILPLIYLTFVEIISASGRDTLIYVYRGFEWISMGTYDIAIEDDEDIEWDLDGDQPTLRILQVRSYILFY